MNLKVCSHCMLSSISSAYRFLSALNNSPENSPLLTFGQFSSTAFTFIAGYSSHNFGRHLYMRHRFSLFKNMHCPLIIFAAKYNPRSPFACLKYFFRGSTSPYSCLTILKSSAASSHVSTGQFRQHSELQSLISQPKTLFSSCISTSSQPAPRNTTGDACMQDTLWAPRSPRGYIRSSCSAILLSCSF